MPKDNKQDKHPTVRIFRNDDYITLKFNFSKLTAEDENSYFYGRNLKYVSIKNGGYYNEGTGMPLVPMFGGFLEIPTDKTLVLNGEPIKTNKYKVRGFDGDKNEILYPAQETWTDNKYREQERKRDVKRKYWDLNNSINKEKIVYPESAKIVQMYGPFNIYGYKSMLIHVMPIQYNPSKKILDGWEKVEVSLKILEVNNEFTANPLNNRETFKKLFFNSFGTKYIDKEKKILGIEEIKKNGCQLLIICDEELRVVAEYFAEWKEKKGIRTEIKTLSEFVFNPKDKQSAIREYIHNKREKNLLLQYVLFLGDIESIPPANKGCEVNRLNLSHISDFYYSTEKQADKNTVALDFPLLAVGRIPESDRDKAMKVVKTIENYEKSPPEVSSYYKFLFASAPDSCKRYVETLEKLCKPLEEMNIPIKRVYKSSKSENIETDGRGIDKSVYDDPKEAHNEIMENIIKGCSIICYRGHGTEKGWANPILKKQHLENLDTKNSSIFLNISCLTGRFNIDPEACFSEVALKEGVAASLIASTCASNTWQNNLLIKGLYDAIFGGIIPANINENSEKKPMIKPRLGDILNYALAYILTKKSTPEFKNILHQMEVYHVIGDPTIEIWREKPRIFEILTKIRNNSIEIRLIPWPDNPIITIWDEDKKLTIGRIEPAENKIISLPLIQIGLAINSKANVKVCCWATGYRYAEEHVIF